jgi:hypothetical protein
MMRYFLLACLIGLAGCSPAKPPVVDNPLLKKMPEIEYLLIYAKAQTVNFFNRADLGQRFKGGGAVYLSKMAITCSAAIIANDPNLVRSIDPNECNRQAAITAQGLSSDLNIEVHQDQLKDPDFWRAYELTAKNVAQVKASDALLLVAKKEGK